MTGFMQPPVPDEAPPRSLRAAAFSIGALILIIMTALRIARPEPFDESTVQPVLPATEETLALGLAAIRKSDGRTAYSLLLPHAQASNNHAQYAVGALRANGLFGEYLYDYCGAATWVDQSARNGHVYAMALLSAFYKEGLGIKRNPEKSALWLRQVQHDLDPNMQIEFKRSLEQFIDWRFGRNSRPEKDVADLETLAAAYQAWNYRDEDPIIVSALPDIPVVDLFAEIFWADSQGCYNTTILWPLELFPDLPPRRVRKIR